MCKRLGNRIRDLQARSIYSRHSKHKNNGLFSLFSRAFFGSIPEDFGNRGESTTTALSMRNKQWQKHYKKDQTTANRITVCVCVCFFFLYEGGTAAWPREFTTGICFWNKVAKFPWLYRGFYFVKTHTSSFDSPWFGLAYGAFATVYSSLVTSLWLIHRDSRNLRELTRRRPCFLFILHLAYL